MSIPSTEPIDSKYSFYECFLLQSAMEMYNIPIPQAMKVHHYSKSLPQSAHKAKYANKFYLPIPDTIITDNSQFIAWLFTDKNGYILNHSKKKLLKSEVLNYFLNSTKNYLINTLHINLIHNMKNETIYLDLERFSNLISLKMSPLELFKEPHDKYLIHFHYMKFILVTFTDKKEFVNIIELYKILNDINLFSGVIYIQNYINLKTHNKKYGNNVDINAFQYQNLFNIKIQPLIIEYKKDLTTGTKEIKLFISSVKPIWSSDDKDDVCYINQNNIQSNARTISAHHGLKSAKSNRSKRTHSSNNSSIHIDGINASSNKKQPMKSISTSDFLTPRPFSNTAIIHPNVQFESISHFNEEVKPYFMLAQTPLSNNNLHVVYEKIIFDFVQLIENRKKCIVQSCKFNFLKFNENVLTFIGGNDIVGIANYEKKNNLLLSMKEFYNKKVPPDIKHFNTIKKITTDHKCYGEFCNFVLPTNSKGINKVNPINDYNLKRKTPSSNKITVRDINYNLPNQIPLYRIKQAYDNPHLVNMVLKAYSIFPKKLNKDSLLNKINQEKINVDKANNYVSNDDKFMVSLFTDLETIDYNNYISGNNKTQYVKKNILYIPTENKFGNLSLCNMYAQVNICYNCAIIYDLISQFISEKQQHNDLVNKGEKYSHSAVVHQAEKMNTILKKDYDDAILRQSVMETIIKQKNEFIRQISKGSCVDRIYKNVITKQDENHKMFNYHLKPNNISNMKVRLNNEHTMFNVKLNLKDNKDELKGRNGYGYWYNNGINIDWEVERKKIRRSADSNKINSDAIIKHQRIHMGYTAHADNAFFENKPKTGKKNKQILAEQMQVLNIDIFHNIKHLFQGFNGEKNSNSKLDGKDSINKSSNIKSLNSTSSMNLSQKKQKVQLSSVYYGKNYDKRELEKYYYISTPLPKFKDNHQVHVEDNIFLTYQEKLSPQFFSFISGLEMNKFLSKSLIFSNDNYTAIPYHISTIPKTEEAPKTIDNKINNKEDDSKLKLIVFIMNDFFDSYTHYVANIKHILSKFYRDHKSRVSIIKLVSFNFPGQYYTIGSAQEKYNNFTLAQLFDRFLFTLCSSNQFNDKYKAFMIGFGNGAHIALTYLSTFDKNASFFKGCFLLNPYFANIDTINAFFNELFIKINKQIEICSTSPVPQQDDIEQFITIYFKGDKGKRKKFKLNGYLSIIDSYKLNIHLNLKQISSPLCIVHSVNNPFIPMQHVSNYFKEKKIVDLCDITEDVDIETIDNIIKKIDLSVENVLFKMNSDAHDIINDFDLNTNRIISLILHRYFNDFIQ